MFARPGPERPDAEGAESGKPAKRRRGGVLLGALALAIAIAAGIGAVRKSDPVDLTIDAGPARTRIVGVATTGSPAPPFDLAALNSSGRISLAALRGKPVVLNFWASWCAECKAEFPLLAEITHKHPGVAVVGITYNDLAFDARRFALDHHATWHLAKGGDGDPVGRAYGVRAIPQTFFIDRAGVIRARAFGLPERAALEHVVARISK